MIKSKNKNRKLNRTKKILQTSTTTIKEFNLISKSKKNKLLIIKQNPKNNLIQKS
jgi:hypothetical protein